MYKQYNQVSEANIVLLIATPSTKLIHKHCSASKLIYGPIHIHISIDTFHHFHSYIVMEERRSWALRLSMSKNK